MIDSIGARQGRQPSNKDLFSRREVAGVVVKVIHVAGGLRVDVTNL